MATAWGSRPPTSAPWTPPADLRAVAVLADLGVSSPQLDRAERGFSFRADRPIDMRMNPEAGESAAELLDRLEVGALADVQFQFGEERLSRRIARRLHAPQIALMARLMENANANATAAVGDRCLVLLQPHGEAAPLFVIHGYGSDVFCYTEFVLHLAPHRPV
jgi:hypothetical protein